ncbi:MAG: hypothetical protein GY760_12075 [Deltaproteobacteria bacterium]|nr:hypothetical protein [Deltaproteobacteria bacterium]
MKILINNKRYKIEEKFVKKTKLYISLLTAFLLLIFSTTYGEEVVTETPTDEQVELCRSNLLIKDSLQIESLGFKSTESENEKALWFKFKTNTKNFTDIFKPEIETSGFKSGFSLTEVEGLEWWKVKDKTFEGGKVTIPYDKSMNVGFEKTGNSYIVYIKWVSDKHIPTDEQLKDGRSDLLIKDSLQLESLGFKFIESVFEDVLCFKFKANTDNLKVIFKSEIDTSGFGSEFSLTEVEGLDWWDVKDKKFEGGKVTISYDKYMEVGLEKDGDSYFVYIKWVSKKPTAEQVELCRSNLLIKDSLQLESLKFKFTESAYEDALWFKFKTNTANFSDIFKSEINTSGFKSEFALTEVEGLEWWDVNEKAFKGGEVTIPNDKSMKVGLERADGDSYLVYIKWVSKAKLVNFCRSNFLIKDSLQLKPLGFEFIKSMYEDVLWFKFKTNTSNFTDIFKPEIDTSGFGSGFSLTEVDYLKKWWKVKNKKFEGGAVTIPYDKTMEVGLEKDDKSDSYIVYIKLVSEKQGIRPDFQNNLYVPPYTNPDYKNAPTEESTSAVFFNGFVFDEKSPLKPSSTDKTYFLSQCSFGQMLSYNVPYTDYAKNLLNEAENILYHQDKPEINNPFCYKDYLYKPTTGGYSIKNQFQSLSEYWTPEHRKRAFEAAEKLKNALKYDPLNLDLRALLLDIYYDMAVVDRLSAKQVMIESVSDSLVYKEADLSISDEIETLENAVDFYKKSTVGYYDLFHNSLGFDASSLDSDAEGMPFGHYIFRKDVPKRSLDSPLYEDTHNNNELVVKPDNGDKDRYKKYQVLDGYKDLVLLFDIQKETLSCATELVRKYISRNKLESDGEKSDKEKALALYGLMQQSYIEGNTLLEICPDYKNASDASGLAEAISGWRNGITQMSFLRDFIDGKVNMLGLTDNFLALIQSKNPKDNSVHRDSYDFYANYLTNVKNDGPLDIALKDFGDAKSEKDTEGNFDLFSLQLEDKHEAYKIRLREIMGALPGTDAYSFPERNRGGEIAQQVITIELAKKRIEKVIKESSNLDKQINSEVELIATKKGITDAINSIYIEYGDKQVALTNRIAAIKVVTKGRSTSSQGTSNSSSSVSGNGQALRGALQAEKERLAAVERAKINSKHADLLDKDSKERIKTMFHRMSVLAIEKMEAEITVNLQRNRLHALYTEKQDVERRLQESEERFSKRYFADPSYRLLKNPNILTAQYSFEKAQKWMFYALKALEYKWLTKFDCTYKGLTFNTNTLFQLRNAKELKFMLEAMASWNRNQAKGHDAIVKEGKKEFSVLKNFWNLNYLDWQSTEKFRDILKSKIVPKNAPGSPDSSIEFYKVEFDTDITNGSFYSRSSWLEKINFMQIKILGGIKDGDSTKYIRGHLKYGSTYYFRNKEHGTVDQENSSGVKKEMESFPTKYWYLENEKWIMEDFHMVPADILLDSNMITGENDFSIIVPDFKEYSIAASKWELYIPVDAININTIDDIYIYIDYTWRNRGY